MLVLLAMFCSIGCSTSARGTPRSRLGALPFPGLWTLYQPANPEDLGRHRYSRRDRLFGRDEVSRGIIYTTRGGFLDIAHVRMTIDWTRYSAHQVRRALSERKASLALDGTNHSVFHVTFNYPDDWDALPDAQRKRVVDELAIRIGQRLGYLMLTWHELISWYGHRTVAVVDERPSAFTYDDVGSHAFGVAVAERVLRRKPGTSYDSAVTAALEAELRRVGAVSKRRTTAAVRAVEGLWWADGKPLKRQLDATLAGVQHDDFAVRPWIVPKLPFEVPDEDVGAGFRIASLDDVFGHDFSGLLALEIAPQIPQAAHMRRVLDARPVRFSGERDVVTLLQLARSQMREQFAADFDQPLPAAMDVGRPGEQPPAAEAIAPGRSPAPASPP